ncbi:MAG: carboxypeptidase regulatory-like domain-containing protein [Acidobacteria bacterium]|nr:carboxypeptidase regulatory-like domain-containing protein [Acidobacteriota bacterium]
MLLRAFLSLLPLLLAAPMAGQTITGEITGTVFDDSGAVVPGATVSLMSETSGARREGKTNTEGIFVFPALQPGTYTIRISRSGFQTVERTGVLLTANDRIAIGEIHLPVGQTTETVTVRSTGETLGTENAQTSALLTPQQLGRIVVRGRDVINLVKLLPGVSQGAFRDGAEQTETERGTGNDLGGQFGTFTPNISGTRSYWNTVTLDGQMGSDAHLVSLFNEVTSVDAIAEVKVVLTNYQAEYGRNSGPQINLVSKSGTREFHGSLYWFKRHEMFNAQDFFNNRDGLPKPMFRYGTFGGTIGGPIYIPGKFNKDRDKLFFFYSREEWRIREPLALGRRTVPSALERQGNFSDTLDVSGRLIPIRDPLGGTNFPGNIIPASRINPNGRAILNLFPLPNITDRSITAGNYNYQFQEIKETPKNTNLLKIDYVVTTKDTLTIRARNFWSDARASQGIAAVNSNWPQMRHHYLFTEDSGKIGWTRVINPSTVNEFSSGFRDLGERGGGSREPHGFDPILRSTNGITLGQFRPEVNPNNLIPAVSFGGVPNAVNVTFDRRIPIDAGDQRFDLVDNLSWIRGSHSFRFGVYLEQNWVSEGPRATNFSGSFNFGRDPNNPLDSNWAFSNAILGNFQSYAEPSARIRGWGKNFLIEWFAQDTWKATRKLTVSYGLRFGWSTPWQAREPEHEGSLLLLNRYDPSKAPLFYRPAVGPGNARASLNPLTGELGPAVLVGAYVPGTGDAVNGMALANDPTVPAGFIEQEPVQVAPRLGLAYDLFGNGKTAVRAGFGITKQSLPSNDYINLMTELPPRVFQPTLFYGNMDTFLQAQGVLFPSSVNAFEVDPVTPSVYNYSFGIQQSVGFNSVLDISYVGNVGRHLIQRRNLNLVPYGARFDPANANPTNPRIALPDNFFRPYPGYGNVTYQENSGTSNYNGLHVALNRRFTSGVQLGVAYTWSKTMGLTNSDQQLLPTYRPYRVWSYGKLSFDQTHKLVINYLWELPKLSALLPNPVIRHIFDNWEWNGITTFSSGTPSGVGFSTVDNADITGGGDGARVNVIAKPELPRGERTFDRRFNTEAFARPAQGDFGNAPKDVFRLPGINNWDFTFIKKIPVGAKETRYLQLRWEMYNAFNHAQFRGVDTSARFDVSGNQVNRRFGQVTSTRFPRIMQAALHLYF